MNLDYKQIKAEFAKRFEQECVPKLTEIENQRKQVVLFSRIAKVLIVLADIVYFLIPGEHSIQWPVIITILLFTGIALYKKAFVRKIKGFVMPQLCKCFGNLNWSTNGKVQTGLFHMAGLIKDYNMETIDDIFRGKINDVHIEIDEVHLQKKEEVRHNGKTETSYMTVFRGVFITLDMNKNFNGKTIIKPDTWSHLSPMANLKHTTLEDVVFEKKYDVFTDDEIEARYLITTSFMERLVNIKTAFKARRTSCAFYQDKLLIALDTKKDLFEIRSINKPIYNIKQYDDMFDEIFSIINLIEHFKLNQKIGL